jgi:hypothetical protein
MSRTADKRVNLRIPGELKAWIKEMSDKNRRYMNDEIILILEKEKALSVSTTQGLDVKPSQN